MTSPTAPNLDTPIEEFHCSAEWHLASLSKAAILIYNWSLRISKKSGRFRVSPNQAAAYFKISPRTAQLGYEELKRVGLFELLESGKAKGEVSIHKPLTHKEWAVRNPGQCATRIEFAWTPHNDLFGQELFDLTDGRIQFRQFEINRFRTFGITEENIIEVFRVWYPKHKTDQELKNNNSHSWRKLVGYHFGEHLKCLASLLQERPSEQVLILKNAFSGRAFLSGYLSGANQEHTHSGNVAAN